MSHLLTALFFALVLSGALFSIWLTVREYWDDMLAALRGDVPARPAHRPWTAPRLSLSARPRPVVAAARPVPQRRAAS